MVRLLRLSSVALFLGIVSGSALAQKAGPASGGATFGPATPAGFGGGGRVTHIVGDGVNYYSYTPATSSSVAGGHSPQMPSSPSTPPLTNFRITQSSMVADTLAGMQRRDNGRAAQDEANREAALRDAEQSALASRNSTRDFLAERDRRSAEWANEQRARDQALGQALIGWSMQMGANFNKAQTGTAKSQKAAIFRSDKAMLDGVGVADGDFAGSLGVAINQSSLAERKVRNGPFLTEAMNGRRKTWSDRAKEYPYCTEFLDSLPDATSLDLLARETVLAFVSDPLFDGMSDVFMKLAVEISISLTPFVGVGRDIFESVTGVDAISGESLDSWGRGFAIAGVVTAGIASKFGTAQRSVAAIESAIANAGKLAAKTAKSADSLAASRHFLDGADVVRYGPMNPGPLHEIMNPGIKAIDGGSAIPQGLHTVADTFRSSSYFGMVLKEDKHYYRVVTSPELAAGGYWSATKPTGALQATIDSALIPEYRNSASVLATIRVPKGTKVYEGAAGEMLGSQSGVFRLGGGHQLYLDLSPKEIKRFKLSTEPLP